MKATRLTTLIALGIALSFAAVGCKTKPQNMTTIHGRKIIHEPTDISSMPAINPNLPTDGTGLISMSDVPGHSNWPENPDQFKAQTVHFAYDSSVIRSDDKAKIAVVADYLKGNPQTAVRAEGNCDERGTEEYNRSLGERRALAAREELIRLGITSDRVDTKSWGEDNPANDHGHNEAAWKQNRRADFILLTPPPK
jgi:outer membrane protein OmpA-like peptidoglycan-associated protein